MTCIPFDSSNGMTGVLCFASVAMVDLGCKRRKCTSCGKRVVFKMEWDRRFGPAFECPSCYNHLADWWKKKWALDAVDNYSEMIRLKGEDQ